MSHEAHEKAQGVFKWFDTLHFPRWAQIKLEELGPNSSLAHMSISIKHCARKDIVTGGVHVLVGNAAGVSLAMMHWDVPVSDNLDDQTPLAEISSMKYLRPLTLDDVELVAEAKFLGVKGRRICIDVQIKNRIGELKATGLFKYAIPRL